MSGKRTSQELKSTGDWQCPACRKGNHRRLGCATALITTVILNRHVSFSRLVGLILRSLHNTCSNSESFDFVQ
jgi:hypothetical protein